MNDLLERLAAANPVRECEAPSIEGVWRKLAEPEVPPTATRSPWRRRGPFGRLRVVPALAAIVLPLIVVIAIVVPLLGAHRGRSRSAAAGQVWATLNPAAQGVAEQQLAGRVGAIVAIDPRTGAVKVLYGNESPGRMAAGRAGAAASLLAAAAEAEYPPEATFDVVTAAAALDAGRYTTRSRIAGPSPLIVSGLPLYNNQDQAFGPITLTQALEASVNTVFAQVGEAVGRPTMAGYMKRFGFYAHPALNGATGPLTASGVRIHGRLTLPTDPSVDLSRLAIGQGGLTVTPLQMATVIAVIADGGKLMVPHLAAAAPTLSGRVMEPATARALALMMRDVVTQGTATPANLKGVQIAGKTGTAQVGRGRTDPWFIGFAPADHPTVAIAVVLRGVRGGYGGTDAAPIAAQVLRTLLGARP